MLDPAMFTADAIGPLVAQSLTEWADKNGLPIQWQYEIIGGLQARPYRGN